MHNNQKTKFFGGFIGIVITMVILKTMLMFCFWNMMSKFGNFLISYFISMKTKRIPKIVEF